MQHAYSGVQVRRTQYAYAYAHTTSQIKLEDARNKFTPRPLQCRCCPGCGAVSAFCIAHTRFPARAPRARTLTHRRDLIFVRCGSTRPHTQTSAHAINQALAATASPKNVLNLPARPARSDGAHTAAVERVVARAVFRVGAADDNGPCMARLAIVRAHESAV